MGSKADEKITETDYNFDDDDIEEHKDGEKGVEFRCRRVDNDRARKIMFRQFVNNYNQQLLSNVRCTSHDSGDSQDSPKSATSHKSAKLKG